MKNIFYLVCMLLIASCNSPESKKTQAQEKLPDPSAEVFKEASNIIPDGNYEEHYANGVLKIKGQMKNGKRIGQWMGFFENGKIASQGIYDNGVQNGPSVVYYENGMKRYEGVYLDDKETGTWKYYDEQGKLVKEEKY